ncbi:FAD:protein FMN transferase [uncultured Sphaerochaeta sp.]|uniref:FAD:protein FMN transferase n=1 Tax=uncultured Sphaerochaeta sp. TaxID=886478 RepID=UPI0029C9FAB0|nr:FAD:protein FMN transferase [uncultured Sphaerochaeta sp.]
MNGNGMNNKASETHQFVSMDTGIVLQCHGEESANAITAMKQEILRMEQLLSRFIDSSDVSNINHAAGKTMVSVSESTFTVIKQAVELFEKTDKRFDITITPLVNLWDFKNRHTSPPLAEIQKTLTYVNAQDILFDEPRMRVGLRRCGQCLDLGGIAKGYAADQAKHIALNHGITSSYLNLGGTIVVIGNRPDGNPWRVGVRHPRKNDSLLGVLQVASTSIVTSGDYERFFFDEQGKRWHHILDPTTGYSAESDLISVTIVSEDSTLADALATTLIILGSEHIPYLQEQFPMIDIIAVDMAGVLYLTERITDSFHPVC